MSLCVCDDANKLSHAQLLVQPLFKLSLAKVSHDPFWFFFSHLRFTSAVGFQLMLSIAFAVLISRSVLDYCGSFRIKPVKVDELLQTPTESVDALSDTNQTVPIPTRSSRPQRRAVTMRKSKSVALSEIDASWNKLQTIFETFIEVTVTFGWEWQLLVHWSIVLYIYLSSTTWIGWRRLRVSKWSCKREAVWWDGSDLYCTQKKKSNPLG